MSGHQQQSPGGARVAETAIDFGNVPLPDNLHFFNSDNYSQAPPYTTQNAADVSGTLSNAAGGSIRNRQANGTAGRFLESKGFGWLLEVNDDCEENVPLLDELDIDLKDIYYKVRCVLLPLPYFRLRLSIVRESPDFWGPLAVVISYALLSIYGQLGVVSWILTMWFGGSFFIFFLARALGGDVAYSQVLGVVGYCLIPLTVIAALSPIFASVSLLYRVWGIFGVCWSVYSAGSLLCVEELEKKRSLLLYPVFLLYVYFFSLYSGV